MYFLEFDGNPSFMVRMSSGSRALCQSGTYEATGKLINVICFIDIFMIAFNTTTVADLEKLEGGF